MDTAVRETTTQAEQKPSHHLHQVFISLNYPNIYLFLFSLLLCYIENRCFWKQCNSIEDLSSTENYFSPSVWKN